MSEKPTHTPGPWQVRTIDGSIGHVETIDGVAVANAEIVGTMRQSNTAERKANAHLIAAAPDFLEAAELHEAALAELDHDKRETMLIEAGKLRRAAIAKAKP